MKRILLTVLTLGIVGALAYYAIGYKNVHTYEQQPKVEQEAPKPEPTPKELMEQATQKLIASAVAASSTDIEKAKEAASKKVEDEMKLKIEQQVREAIAATNEKRQAEIEKKLSF